MTMEKEKKSIKNLKIIFGALLVVGIAVAIFLYWFLDAKVVDWGWNAVDDPASTNTNEYYVIIEFNVKVKDAEFEVAFYDENDNIIAHEIKEFTCEDEFVIAYFTVDGNPETCGFLKGGRGYTYESNMLGFYIAAIADIILLMLFVQTMTLKCKTYYYQDKEIVVYAGFLHRHVKVNGVEVCRRSNAFTYGANLSCLLDDGSQLCAYISRSNKITVMVNNQYLPEVKNPTAAYQPASQTAYPTENQFENQPYNYDDATVDGGEDVEDFDDTDNGDGEINN